MTWLANFNAQRREEYAVLRRGRVRPYASQRGLACSCGKPAVSRGMCREHYNSWYLKRRALKEMGLVPAAAVPPPALDLTA
jgi:hypothetical protein